MVREKKREVVSLGIELDLEGLAVRILVRNEASGRSLRQVSQLLGYGFGRGVTLLAQYGRRSGDVSGFVAFQDRNAQMRDRNGDALVEAEL